MFHTTECDVLFNFNYSFYPITNNDNFRSLLFPHKKISSESRVDVVQNISSNNDHFPR